MRTKVRKTRKTRKSARNRGFGFISIKKALDFSIKLPGFLIILEIIYDDVAQLWSLVLSLLQV